jgi:hypothetical protein
MGEAKRRKKLDPNWGKFKPLTTIDTHTDAVLGESERYRVITVNNFFKIASVSEIEYQAGYYDYPPDWANQCEFEGTLSQCESWLDEYRAETGHPW